MELYYLLVFASAVAASFVAVDIYRRENEKRKIVIGIDINKRGKPRIAESAGIALLVPIWAGIFATGMMAGFNGEVVMWGLLLSVFAVIGFADDMKTKFVKKEMPWKVRALPIALISTMFAYVYAPAPAFWVIPVALFIAGLASFQNTFAGLNGWEVGSGFIISVASAALLWGTPYFGAAVILAGAVFGLLLLNLYPAKVFPGDSGTMLIGSAIAGLFVLTGNIMLMSVCTLFFIPHMVDFFLLKLPTARGDLTQAKAAPYKVRGDGRLEIPRYADGKARYDFAKMLMRIFGPMKERQIVAIIWCVVALNCTAVLFFAGVLG
ncbi:MAG: hypothetical protein V1676_02015 [Candidatus Diapherotrites archaeon]